MVITAKDLDFSRARTKRPVFNDLFPKGLAVTSENARKATRAGLSLRWMAAQVMDFSQFERFIRRAQRLLRAYLRATAGTREILERLEHPFPAKTRQWIEADMAHTENKRRHPAEVRRRPLRAAGRRGLGEGRDGAHAREDRRQADPRVRAP